MMTDRELKLYRIMFSDFWNCFYRHRDLKNTDEWWGQFIAESKGLYEKHKQTDEKVAHTLCVMIMQIIQRCILERRKNESS